VTVADFTWITRQRNTVGGALSGQPNVDLTLEWAPAIPGATRFPWALPAFPSLLLLGFGFELACSATVNTRRPRLTITYPNGATCVCLAFNTTTAGQTRRYEFSAGMSLDAGTAGQQFRECLPDGLVLLGSESQITTLTLRVDNAAAGDSYSVLPSLSGMLLPG